MPIVEVRKASFNFNSHQLHGFVRMYEAAQVDREVALASLEMKAQAAEIVRIKQAANHSPECNFHKWDFNFSWADSDCSCPSQAAEIERLEFENQGYESRERSYCAQIEGHDAEIEIMGKAMGEAITYLQRGQLHKALSLTINTLEKASPKGDT
jgi:hypothetical protein